MGTVVNEASPVQERTCRIVDLVEDVESLRPAWTALHEHPNSDFDSYLTSLNSMRNARPFILVVSFGGKPDAILVGREEETRLDLKIGYARLGGLRARVLTFIWGGLLGSITQESCEYFARAILSRLRSGQADVAFFNHLKTSSPLYNTLRSIAGSSLCDHFPVLQNHRLMTVPKSELEFWARFSPKVRKNQRWQVRRFLRDHADDIRVRCFESVSELDLMIRETECVAGKTYQRGMGVGFSDTDRMRDNLRFKAGKGWLRTYVLYAAGRPCAFWSGTLYHQTFYSDFMGYDPTYSRYSPGMCLILRVIEGFCATDPKDHVTAIDFGLGDAQYKMLLGDIEWQDASAYIFAPSVRGQVLSIFRMLTGMANKVGKAILERTGSLHRLKRLWRRNFASSTLQNGGDIPPSEDPGSVTERS